MGYNPQSDRNGKTFLSQIPATSLFSSQMFMSRSLKFCLPLLHSGKHGPNFWRRVAAFRFKMTWVFLNVTFQNNIQGSHSNNLLLDSLICQTPSRVHIYISVSVCVCKPVCMHLYACVPMYVYVYQGVIMENKGLLVQSETVGFEVRWEMIFCLAEQAQWSYSTSPLTAHCPTTTSPSHTHTQGCSGIGEEPGGERAVKSWGMREVQLKQRVKCVRKGAKEDFWMRYRSRNRLMMLKLYLCNTHKLLYISCSWMLSLFTQFTHVSSWRMAASCHHLLSHWYVVSSINVYILKTQFGAC